MKPRSAADMPPWPDAKVDLASYTILQRTAMEHGCSLNATDRGPKAFERRLLSLLEEYRADLGAEMLARILEAEAARILTLLAYLRLTS